MVEEGAKRSKNFLLLRVATKAKFTEERENGMEGRHHRGFQPSYNGLD